MNYTITLFIINCLLCPAQPILRQTILRAVVEVSETHCITDQIIMPCIVYFSVFFFFLQNEADYISEQILSEKTNHLLINYQSPSYKVALLLAIQ